MEEKPKDSFLDFIENNWTKLLESIKKHLNLIGWISIVFSFALMILVCFKDLAGDPNTKQTLALTGLMVGLLQISLTTLSKTASDTFLDGMGNLIKKCSWTYN